MSSFDIWIVHAFLWVVNNVGTLQTAIASIIFIVGVTIGASFTYKYMEAHTLELENAITKANLAGQIAIKEANKKNIKIQQEQAQKVLDIQQAHNEAIEINNRLTDALHDARLQLRQSNARRDAGVSKDNDTTIPEVSTKAVDNAAGYDKLDEIIDKDAAIADENTRYAQDCKAFVDSIPKEMIK